MDPDKTNNKSTQKTHVFCKKAEKHSIIKKVNQRNCCSEASLSLLLLLQASGGIQNKAEKNPKHLGFF